jgi:hypothetical protein
MFAATLMAMAVVMTAVAAYPRECAKVSFSVPVGASHSWQRKHRRQMVGMKSVVVGWSGAIVAISTLILASIFAP